mgnify:CR=1 FL=1
MSLKKILDRVVYPNVKNLNFEGIEFQVVDKIKKEDYSVGEYEILVYELYNPLDLPYCKVALEAFIDEQITNSLKLASYNSLALGFTVNYLWRFSDNVKKIYIPKRVISEISECLSSSKFTMGINIPYLIQGEVDCVIDINYDNYVDFDILYGEVVQVEFIVFVSNVRKKIGKNNYVTIDDQEIKSEIREQLLVTNDDKREYLQDDVYRCSASLMNIPTFYDNYWMGLDFTYSIKFN